MKYKEVDLLQSREQVDAVHNGHWLAANAGFESEDRARKAFLSSEENAQRFFSGFDLNQMSPDQFWEIWEKEKQNHKEAWGHLDDYDERSAPFFHPESVDFYHGGGTLFEYAVHAKLNGKPSVNLAFHESRMGALTYPGEKRALKNVPRGDFVVNIIDDIRQKITEYEQILGVRINLFLERENFQILAVDERKTILERLKPLRDKIQGHILSTHWMLMQGAGYGDPGVLQNLRFVDNDVKDIADILKSYAGLENLIAAYVGHMISHVEGEGKQGYVLGHPGLIFCQLGRLARKNDSEISLDDIRDAVKSDRVKKLYKYLFDLVRKKEMFVDINISKSDIRGHGFYEQWILEYIKDSGVMLTLGSDTHAIDHEKVIENNWDGVRARLIEAGVFFLNELDFPKNLNLAAQ